MKNEYLPKSENKHGGGKSVTVEQRLKRIFFPPGLINSERNFVRAISNVNAKNTLPGYIRDKRRIKTSYPRGRLSIWKRDISNKIDGVNSSASVIYF